MKKRIIALTVSFSLLGGLIYFSDIGKVFSSVLKANLFFIFVGVCLWVLGNLFRTLRWKYLLKRIGMDLPLSKAIQLFTAGLYLSNISPAKTGDPARSLLLKRNCNYSFSKSLPAIFLERIFDIIVTILISSTGLFLLATQLGELSFWFTSAVIVWIVVVLIGLWIIISKNRTQKFLSKFHSLFSFFPKIKTLESRIEDLSENLNKSFLTFKNKKTLLVTFLLSLAIWLLEGVILVIGFHSLGIKVSFLASVTIIPVSILIGIFTLLPGALGSMEIITTGFFLSLYSITPAQATSGVLIARFLSFWMYILTGSVLLGFKIE